MKDQIIVALAYVLCNLIFGFAVWNRNDYFEISVISIGSQLFAFFIGYMWAGKDLNLRPTTITLNRHQIQIPRSQMTAQEFIAWCQKEGHVSEDSVFLFRQPQGRMFQGNEKITFADGDHYELDDIPF